jgi:hypothetical protein
MTSNPRVVSRVSGRSGGVYRRASVQPMSLRGAFGAEPGLWSSQRLRPAGASLRHPSDVQRVRLRAAGIAQCLKPARAGARRGTGLQP